jgi:hypothetical protein
VGDARIGWRLLGVEAARIGPTRSMGCLMYAAVA